MSELIPVYRIENILARNNSKRTVTKQLHRGFSPLSALYAALQHLGLPVRSGFAGGDGKRIELRRCIDAFGAVEQSFDS
jgi:hypothetical protein